MRQYGAFKKIGSILLVLCLCGGMLTACKSGEDVSSTTSNASQFFESDATAENSLNDNSEISDISGTDSTTTNSVASSVNAKTSNTTNNKTGKNVFASDPYSEIPASLKGTTLSMMTWYEMPEEEKKAIAAFTKKTGISVKVTETSGFPAYTEKLISLISSQTPPDMVTFNSDQFPVWTGSVLQPLDSATFRLDDSIWDKSQMDLFKVNGQYYGVNIPGNFQNDTMYVLYYNATMLEDNGITSPRELWKNNNWNWNTCTGILKDIKKNIKGVVPISFYKEQTVAWSAGSDFVTYDGKKVYSNLSDMNLINAYSMLSSWRSLGYYSGEKLASELSTGKLAMLCGITFGMKSNNGFWAGDGGLRTGTVDAVPFPSPAGMSTIVPMDGKMFGIPKGTKNAEATAFFLRYFLDPENYDMDNLFLNNNLKQTFYAIQSYPKQVNYAQGVIEYVDESSYDDLNWYLVTADSSQVKVALDKHSNIITKAVERVNETILDQ